jgi:hypothetical protein
MTDLGLALLDALDERDDALLAERLAPHLAQMLDLRPEEPRGGWLDSHSAAQYLGMSRNALHKLTAERAIPFEQEGPGCKLFFKRAELDAWRQSSGTRTRASRVA